MFFFPLTSFDNFLNGNPDLFRHVAEDSEDGEAAVDTGQTVADAHNQSITASVNR